MNTSQTFSDTPAIPKNTACEGIHGALLLPVNEKWPCLKPHQKNLQCSTAREQMGGKGINSINYIGAAPARARAPVLGSRLKQHMPQSFPCLLQPAPSPRAPLWLMSSHQGETDRALK